jgi:hypothetical protein
VGSASPKIAQKQVEVEMEGVAMNNQPTDRRRGMVLGVGVLLLAIITILLAVQTLRTGAAVSDKLEFHTPYQAVLLNNGLAYFGKVESQDSKFLTLSDVYYIRSGTNQGSAAKSPPQNVLVKRGKEWHEPDRMTINLQSIVFIEPVSATSQVAKLIDQSKSKGE